MIRKTVFIATAFLAGSICGCTKTVTNISDECLAADEICTQAEKLWKEYNESSIKQAREELEARARDMDERCLAANGKCDRSRSRISEE